MLRFDWQIIAALACVAVAAWFLLRRAWRLLKVAQGRSASAACGSCAGCEPHGDHKEQALVPLDVKSATTQRLGD